MDEEDYVYVVLKNVVIEPPNAGTVEPTAAKFSVNDTGGKLLSDVVKLKNALSNKLGLDVTSTTSGDIHTFTSVDKFTLKISPQGGNRLDAELNIDESRDLGETLQIIDETIDEVLLFTINGTRDYKLLSAKIPTNVNIFRNLALRLTDILAPMYRFDISSSKPMIMASKHGNQIYIVTPPGPYDSYTSMGMAPAYTNGFVSFNIYATNTNGRLASDEELIAIAKDVANGIKKVIADGPKSVTTPPTSVTPAKPSKQEVNPPTVILGHAGDVCLDNGKLEELIVPPNCVYVTFTVCGLVAIEYIKIFQKFFHPENKVYLDDPIKYENELEKIFGQNIHVHKPKSTYINSTYYPTGYYTQYNPTEDLYLMSGVVPIDGKSQFIPDRLLIPYNDTRGLAQTIPKFFKYSIFPTEEYVKNKYRDATRKVDYYDSKRVLTEVHRDIIITQKELFELRPGVYYNPLCRVVTKACINEPVLRRAKSLASMNKDIQYGLYAKNAVSTCLYTNDCDAIDRLIEMLPQLTPSQISEIDSVAIQGYYLKHDFHSSLNAKKNIHVNKLLDGIKRLNQPPGGKRRKTRRGKKLKRKRKTLKRGDVVRLRG
jgi:hypothetical protein